jgi:hypothetical protein
MNSNDNNVSDEQNEDKLDEIDETEKLVKNSKIDEPVKIDIRIDETSNENENNTTTTKINRCDEKECFENEKKQKRLKNLTVSNFFNTNYLYFIVALTCLYFISNNFIYGILTFISTHLLYYYAHLSAHQHDNFFTKIHEYHHSHTNLLSHISQVLIELFLLSILFMPSYFGCDITKSLEIYVLLFASLLYTTVHNINYGCFRVNNVHSIHHMRNITNYGPDLCDIIFDSKDRLNDDVENITHYIPNMIILTILLIFVKNEKFIKLSTVKNIGYYFIFLNMICCFIFSLYLYVKKQKSFTLYDIFVGKRQQNPVKK